MKTYSDYINKFFPGIKVQKISVDAGFSCPNRDGTISMGGCIYCRNDSFSPSYCNSSESISSQLEKGKKFFARKYPEMKYLAYFQSYTGTHGRTPLQLEKLYREAIDEENIVGLVIATRPDSIPEPVVSLLAKLNREKPVFIEIGAETSHDSTLKLINRNHSWNNVESGIRNLAEAGLHCGIHLIAGLPEESEEMILETIEKTIQLPVETIKLHQLQILYGTELYNLWKTGRLNVKPFELEEYLDLCARIVRMVPDNIIIERFLSQSPPDLVAAPKWGMKNYEFMARLEKKLK